MQFTARFLIITVMVGACLFTHQEQAMSQDHDGYHPLFDGQSAAGWRGYGRDTMPDGWVVDDGALHRQSGGGDIMTDQQYQDFDLVFEWKVAEGGNSGVMYRVKESDQPAYFTGPEYQILDNAKHQDGKNLATSAAALYGLYAPMKDTVRPAGEWNEGRIVVEGNHIQHWLNGKRVVDCVMWSDDWQHRYDDSKFAPWQEFARMPRGHIVLQDHGDPVWFRNIRIKELTQ